MNINANDAKAAGISFFKTLLDFSFSEFVTPQIVKILYGILLLLGACIALAGFLNVLKYSALVGLLVLIIVVPLFLLFWVVITRIYMEMVIVAFKIAGHLKSIDEKNKL